MKILFTGASSFTGYWFVKELIKTGNEVHTIFTKSSVEEYERIRKVRVEEIIQSTHSYFSCNFGDNNFLNILNQERYWDILCHHAADVTNYKNPDFNINSALNKNTNNIIEVLDILKTKNCNTILLTGSVFENGEGSGSDSLPAFSPYGLSKSFTFETFKYFCRQKEIKLGKFVIPNPFGPFEDPRFTTYLAKKWLNKEVAVVNTPDYVRDNILVQLLAKTYNYFCQSLFSSLRVFEKINPSGYVESQGAFTQRFSNEMQKRLNMPCEFELKNQMVFPEPRVRTNTELASKLFDDWDEEKSWDGLAEYYLKFISRQN